MAQLLINTGSTANDGTGDSLRNAAYKINQNFTELYAQDLSVSSVGITGDYADLINKPTIPATLSDLTDPNNLLNTISGNIVGNIETDGGLYNIGTASAGLHTLYARRLSVGTTGAEMSLNAPGGLAIDTDSEDLVIDATVITMTSTAQFNINSQQLNVIGPINGDLTGQVNADNGALLVDAANAKLVGTIENTAATFNGTVDFTNATVTGLPAVFSGDYNDLTNQPTLSAVSASGSYNDLVDKPTLFSGAYSDLTGTPTLATVATSGAYTDLTGTPTLATVATSGAYGDLVGRIENLDDTLALGNTSTRAMTVGALTVDSLSTTGAVTAASFTGDGSGLTNLEWDAIENIPTLPLSIFDNDTGFVTQTEIDNSVANYMSIADLKTIVAASADFADFQARIAAL